MFSYEPYCVNKIVLIYQCHGRLLGDEIDSYKTSHNEIGNKFE